MINAVHDDETFVFSDLIHDSVCTPPGCVKSGQFALKRPTHPSAPGKTDFTCSPRDSNPKPMD